MEFRNRARRSDRQRRMTVGDAKRVGKDEYRDAACGSLVQ